MKVLLIQRAERFSPNSVEKDRAILDTVGARLLAAGHEVESVSEEQPFCSDGYDRIYSMGRLPETLTELEETNAINSSEGIANCARCRLEEIMRQIGTPMAPREGSYGYWIKRGDAAAQNKSDVQFAATKAELEQKIAQFVQCGITEYTISAHVPGDLIKFYGVAGTGFFRYYYPTDDGESKFGDEQRNGAAHHYPFEVKKLQNSADILAEAVGIKVYGGDCIVDEEGRYYVIDFNDWPSFSRCREEAATAIASLI
jgi:hypothetical protein